MTQIRIQCGVLEFLIQYEKHEAYTQFTAYRVVGEEMDDSPLFERKDAQSSEDTVSELELDQAQVFLSGDIRFDECSNLYFPDSNYHFCGKDQARSFGPLIDFLMDL